MPLRYAASQAPEPLARLTGRRRCRRKTSRASPAAPCWQKNHQLEPLCPIRGARWGRKADVGMTRGQQHQQGGALVPRREFAPRPASSERPCLPHQASNRACRSSLVSVLCVPRHRHPARKNSSKVPFDNACVLRHHRDRPATHGIDDRTALRVAQADLRTCRTRAAMINSSRITPAYALSYALSTPPIPTRGMHAFRSGPS
jgi:hypothetical protein